MNDILKTKPYYINRIRLINFHNFVHETIEIKHGGHLFVLGDNASGKSTLIDAIHYVLTAGDDMEFNSAARVAGSKSEGRRAQGIISRYNVDVGHINPNGGITYAALEIIGRHGKPTTIAIGMSIGSVDENVHRWGIIRECPLEEVPFTVKEKKNSRPRSSKEIKKVLGKVGYYGQISSYKKELANRFFGGVDMFTDFCRFVSMGKAYREIVTHSSDYHQLFKRLLPAPGTELFDRIVNSLRTLDDSREVMESLKEKLDFIQGLSDTLLNIDKLRNNILGFESIALQLDRSSLERTIEVLKEDKEDASKKLLAVNREVRTLRNEKTHIEKQLADYQEQDVGGLIRQEKELNNDLEQGKAKVKSFTERLEEREHIRKTAEEGLNKHREILDRRLNNQLKDITSLGSDLPFSIKKLMTAFSNTLDSDEIESSVDSLPIDEYLLKAREAQTEYLKNEMSLKNSSRRNADNEQEINDDLAKVERVPEFTPDISDFNEVEEELKHNMIEAKPVFKGLEWKAGLKKETMAWVEELVGDEVLATFVISEEAFNKAEEVVFPEFPGIRLAVESRSEINLKEMPKWLHDTFDLKNSDPQCIAVLANEMIARQDPQFEKTDDYSKVSFRSHERSFYDQPAKLIGAATRRREQERVLKEKKKELKEVQKEGREIQEEMKKLKNQLTIINKFIELMEPEMKKAYNEAASVNRSKSDIENINEWVKENDRQIKELTADIQLKQERLDELKKIISKKDLKNLQEKIQKTTGKMKIVDEKIESTINTSGRIQQQIENLTREIKEKNNALKENREFYEKSLERLKDLPEDISNPEEYLGWLRKDNKIRSASHARRAAGKCHEDELQMQGSLRERINEPRYGFSYNEKENQLSDRNSRDLFDIQKSLEKDISEQREVINERTTELFRRIIMDELVKFLQIHVYNLDAMVKTINELLNSRWFGNNKYTFQLSPIPKYERLVRIIRKYNYLDPASEEELRNFFEDYKADITDTEVGEIPELLDYRNWYHYEMKVYTSSSEGKIMDRHMKSIGSGGEQAVPNYLLILTIAHFLYQGSDIKLYTLLFDEAFYGIDAGRRDQLMAFASALGLQLFIASPDQDGVKREIKYSTSLFIVKDENHDVHLYPFHWENPDQQLQQMLFEEDRPDTKPIEFGDEIIDDEKISEED